MPILPADCYARKIGSRARAILHYQINSNNWDYREETGNDVGRDCIIELIENEQWNNNKIEGQIKGTKTIKHLANGAISFSIATKTLNYAIRSGYTFVLFLVDIDNEITYFLSIQEYFIENPNMLNKLSEQQTINVHLNSTKVVATSDNELQNLSRNRYIFSDGQVRRVIGNN